MRNLIFITTLFLVISCSENKDTQLNSINMKIVDYPTFSKVDSVQVIEKNINCDLIGNCYKGGIFFDSEKIKMIKSEKIKKDIYFDFLNKNSSNNLLEKDYTAFDFLINNEKHSLTVLNEESIKKYCTNKKLPLQVKCNVYWFKIYSNKKVENYLIVNKIN